MRTAAAAAVVVAGLALPGGRAGATGAFSFARVAGESRSGTAAALALGAFESATGAVLATGESFPDALAASFIAGYVNSPILLVERDRVPDATKAALTKLGVKEVVLLGGTAAISEAVQSELDVSYEVVRLFGQDRFATAANIALAVNPGDIGELDGDRTAFLTYGYTFADAMALGPLAFAGRFPILLNGSGGLGTPARVAVERLQIERVVIVGGPAAISDDARRELQAQGITVERLAGVDRFATAARIADFAIDRLGFIKDHVNLVGGLNPNDPAEGFADALAGSVHAGIEHAPLLLTHPTELSTATHLWIEGRAKLLTTGDIFGGSGAVGTDVKDDATSAARRVPGAVVSIDLDADAYVYAPDDTTARERVVYAAGDRFVVDGEVLTVDDFEEALSLDDRVHVTIASARSHSLTNASASD